MVNLYQRMYIDYFYRHIIFFDRTLWKEEKKMRNRERERERKREGGEKYTVYRKMRS